MRPVLGQCPPSAARVPPDEVSLSMTYIVSAGSARLARSMAMAFFALVAAPAWAQEPPVAPADPNAVVATVDGKPLTEADLALALEEINPAGTAVDAQRREQVLDFLIKFKLVAAAAEKDKVADDAQFAAKLTFLREKAMMETYLDKVGKAGVTDEAVQKVYDETIKDIKPEEEVHARHVLLETEEDAKKVAEQIKGGEDFGKLAKEMSKDPGSGAEGGDLGFFTKEQMVPEFAEAAFKMNAGDVSGPIKSQYGWHIIKVEEKRQRAIPKLDEVRPQIEDYVRKKAQEEEVTRLLEAAKIDRPNAPKAEEPADPAKK